MFVAIQAISIIKQMKTKDDTTALEKKFDWSIRSFGRARGCFLVDGNEYNPAYQTDLRTVPASLPDVLEVTSESGKFADSEDAFLYCYFTIDPKKENFRLSARFEVLETGETPTQQTGYGILAADTVYSDGEGLGRHRNHLLLGRFRTDDGRNHGYGLRAVGGYTDPKASEFTPVRKLDPSRVFQCKEKEDRISAGDACTFCLHKTDKGFEARMRKDEIEETISFPGCDFLLHQDQETISVGFALGGNLRIRISNIQVQVSKGKVSSTPENTIGCFLPDYPFLRNVFQDGLSDKAETIRNRTVFVSPEGKESGKGSEADPLDIMTALQMAGGGSEIVLLDGVYHLSQALYLASGSGGTYQKRMQVHALHPRQVVLDGSDIKDKVPLMVIRGHYWIFEGIVFENAPLSGLMVCGSGNIIRNCEARCNGDTGILICAYPGDNRDHWPSYNRIEDCDSFDNCDAYLCNADGFGAKLSVGKGNEFYRCIAHHNIDDGFDLYNKSIIGPTEPVLLEKCIAYENGRTMNDVHVRKSHSGGTGFKLGGEYQPSAHEVWDCVAFLNNEYGFSSNSNPFVRLHYCTSFGNRRRHKNDNYCLYYGLDDMKPAWVKEQLFPLYKWRITGMLQERLYCRMLGKDVRPARKEDGSIRFNYFDFGKHRLGANVHENRDKNVLMMISSLGGGGAERVTSIMANELSQKYKVHLLYLNDKKQKYPIKPEVNVIDASWNKEIFLDKFLHSRIRWPFKFYSVLSAKMKYHIDVTISMLIKPNQYNAMIRWLDRRIMSERNDPLQKSPEEYEKSKGYYAKADLLVFQSRHVQSLYSKEIQAKSVIIRNPIGVPCYADPDPKDKIVTVGRYIGQKNHKLLIRSFSGFHQTHPTYTLHLYGDGELREELQHLIDELHLQDAVFLEGFKADIHTEIKNAKIFALSSDYEGMSNALMEAMMMGIPCISTACTGSDELLTDEETGLLVPVGDEAALASAMARLADDEELRKKLRGQAQLQSMEFEKETVIRAWERVMFR